MAPRALQFILGGDLVRRIAGPILDKELRVASRRRRNFVLRFAYLVLLAAFVIVVWLDRASVRGPGAYSAMQMSGVGREIVLVIAWFQFITMQLMAIILLAAAISEEVYRRTLGVLMTTPITSFQIIVGKLLGSLLQMLLLLAISLPLLAIVRVFGGVPWEFVVAGLCITLTTALFAGALTLYFSVGSRRVYWVFLKTVVAMFVLFLAIPAFCIALAFGGSDSNFLNSFPAWFNPYVAMDRVTDQLMTVRPGVASYPWQGHCLGMLGASALLVAVCVARVRKVALAEISGERPARSRAAKRAARPGTADPRAAGRIRRIRGSPVLWRELRTRLAPSRRSAVWGTIVVVGFLVASYAIAWDKAIRYSEFHMVYIQILMGLAMLTTGVVAATGITSEKEAGSWPLLLCTPLARGHILLAKAAGVFRRCLPVWLLLVFHVALFTVTGYIHPVVAVHLGLVGTGVIVFLAGSGLFFSALCRRTTAAVVMNLGLAIGLWAAVPILALLVSELAFGTERYGQIALCVNPMAQVSVVTEHLAGLGSLAASLFGVFGSSPPARPWEFPALRYDWPKPIGHVGFAMTTLIVLCTAALHAYLGIAFGALAAARLRRGVFQR